MSAYGLSLKTKGDRVKRQFVVTIETVLNSPQAQAAIRASLAEGDLRVLAVRPVPAGVTTGDKVPKPKAKK